MKTFTEYVQAHERAWGTEQYKGKPTLQQILEAKVVCFWYPTDTLAGTPEENVQYLVTLHPNTKHINAYVEHLVWHTKQQLPHSRLAKVFLNQKPLRIKGVKVILDYEK